MSKKQRKMGSGFEGLERKTLMAADISFNSSTGILTITGDQYVDRAFVRFEDNEVDVTLESQRPNGSTRTLDRDERISDVRQIVFDGLGGNDVLNVSQGILRPGISLLNVMITYHAGDGVDHMDNNSSAKSTAYGGAGNDTLIGGSAVDVLFGESNDDTIVGRGGNDRLYGGDGNDTVNGDGGDDYLWGGMGIDTLSGGDHNDRLYGGGDRDVLYGQGGDDTLDGGYDGAIDDLWGGSGRDSFVAKTVRRYGTFQVILEMDRVRDFGSGDILVTRYV